ncbi:hypothetical protein BJY00DRAFT_204588 [Aspergillus carlsbadensis]|nr:hypothetical protein BJY00DRAFT_204588 [Aspergillus carlsbadensis]
MLHYCVICGVVIGRSSGAPEDVPSVLEWYQALRVVLVHKGSEDASALWLASQPAILSGVGFVNSLDRIIAPSDHEHCFADNGANLIAFTPFHDLEADSWCFTFHASCWDILLERVPEGRSNVARFSTVFFQALFCTSWGRYRYIRPGHDFGGASQFQKPVGNTVRNITDQGFEYLLAQPSRFRDLSEILSSLPQAPRCSPERSAKRTKLRPLSGSDILSRLPIEVLFLILSLLPSVDIQQLRLASRYIASITDPGSLLQSFWCSRYCADFEMGFAAPTQVVGNQNWRDAYFALRQVLRDASNALSERARNRKRIWKLTGINSALLAQFTPGICLRGDLCTQSTRLGHGGGAISDSSLGGSMISGQIFEGCDGLLRSGSWRLHDRAIVLPLDDCTIQRIRVSTVLFNSQRFISGLQFRLVDTSTQVVTDLSLGYISPDTSHPIEIPLSTRISGLKLAICSRGVPALRILSEGAENCGSGAQWVGNIGSANPDIAVGKLSFWSGEARKIRLVAALDAFKIIALGVAEPNSTDLEIFNGYASQPLWTPSYPRETVSLVPMPELESSGFDPILNVDFGGPNGERLPRLTRIVARMLGRADPIVGLTFYFCDHTSDHFGRHGSMEVSSFIDGPGGERISSVIVETSTADCRVLSLLMHTNRGNALIFAHNEMLDSDVTEVRPRFCDKPNPFIVAREDCVEGFQAPVGQQITGFTAILEAEHGSFKTFGLQCEKGEMPPATLINGAAHPSSVSVAARLSAPIGSYLIQEKSNGCRAYTSASLRSVKSIGFSSGHASSPRLPSEVSGLWFEYYESCPSIVGQWLSEGTTRSLEEDERIAGISIWLSNSRMSFSEKYYTGRVVRVSISTSLRTVSYPDEEPLPAEGYTVMRFEENRLEELSSLVWVFNNAWDFPRVIKTLRPSRAQVVYWDPHQFAERRPWTAPQPALWVGASGADKLVSVTGYHGRWTKSSIIGLRFSYSSGVCRDVGDVSSSQALELVQFHPDEDIAQVTLVTDWDGLIQIMFHCSKPSDGHGGSDSAKTRCAFVGVSPDELTSSITSGGVTLYEIDLLRRRYKSHYSSGAGDLAHCEEALPEGEVAGLWGFLRPHEKLVVGCVVFSQEGSASASDDA